MVEVESKRQSESVVCIFPGINVIKLEYNTLKERYAREVAL